MLVTTARYPTAPAEKYLRQLCKHFAHKVEVALEGNRGRAMLPPGPAELTADPDGLSVRIEAADAKGMIHARFVIDSHLVTFAHREGFTGLRWETEAG